MCGILGRIIKNKDTFINLENFKKSLHCLNHRGPDDEGIFIKDNIALGHKRLSILDISYGKQPMFFNKLNRNVVLIYNGETYNFQNLRRKVIMNGIIPKTYCDTEIVLLLYVLYGKSGFDMLNGMYAFAIYDFDLEELILCRDRFGIKPLYYMNTDQAFSFSSEVKSLKIFDDYKFSTNENSISEYLTFQFYITDETPFQKINSVPTASYLSYKDGIISIEKYYETNLLIDDSISYEEAKKNIFTLLENSISQNTISDVPIGSYLSGGIDSSIISSILGISKSENITFTGGFDISKEYDEKEFSQSVLDKYNLENYKVYPTLDDFINTFDEILISLDYPTSGPGVFPQYFVSKLASKKIKVILGGQGGDEIFGGYVRYFIAYFEQALKGSIEGTQDRNTHMGLLVELINNLPILKQYIPMLKSFWSVGLFEEKEKRYFNLINKRSSIEHIYSEDYLNRFSDKENYEKFLNVFGNKNIAYFNRMTNFDLKYSLQGLLHVEDRMSMLSSIESRVPFLDFQLVDYVNSIQPKYKFKGGKLKNILIDSFKEVLPKKIINRVDKKGFPVPLNEWKKDKKMKEFLADILLSKRARERGIYKKDILEKEIINDTTFSRGLWGALNYERWLQLNE